MYCPNCGNVVGDDDCYCMYCSYRLREDVPAAGPDVTVQDNYVRIDTKSTGWALFMSLILPGLGALYVDSDIKGLMVLIASFLAAGVALYLWFSIGVLLMFVLWVYGIVLTSRAIDSYKIKNNIR